MDNALPIQSLTAIATVTASTITAAISFINLTLNKEQKTSEFRQAWIDGLRQDLASFFACARAFARATEELKLFNTLNDKQPLAINDQKISEIRYEVAENLYKIRLRLNLAEQEHKELLRLIRVAIDAQQSMLAGAGNTENILKAIENAAEYAPQILKSEWERVKKGELPFRVVRNWITPLVFFTSLLFVILAWTGNIKI